jgi:hypothetical protein
MSSAGEGVCAPAPIAAAKLAETTTKQPAIRTKTFPTLETIAIGQHLFKDAREDISFCISKRTAAVTIECGASF